MIYPSLNDLPVHSNVIKYLIASLSGQDRHHAYLFYGTPGSGKRAVSLAFGRHFICTVNSQTPCLTCPSCIKYEKLQHPDVRIVLPVNKKNDTADPESLEKAISQLSENEFLPFPHVPSQGYYVESIRQLKSDSKFASTEAPYRVMMLFDIEYMNPSSANAFLNLLEEPPDRTVILMTTNNIHAILPTIRSRCLKMQIPIPTLDMISNVFQRSKIDDFNSMVIQLSNHSISKALELHQSMTAEEREFLVNYLRYSIVLKPVEISKLVNSITATKNKDRISFFLTMLQLWFRDANILLQNQENATIINSDKANELNKFVSKYKHINFSRIDEIVDKTRKEIAGNANANMQLVSLAIDINNCIRVS